MIVVEGERIAAVNPRELPAGATEIDLGDVTLLPGLMDMEINMLLGGPSGGNTRSDVQDDPAFRTLARHRRTAARRCSPASRPCATSGCS